MSAAEAEADAKMEAAAKTLVAAKEKAAAATANKEKATAAAKATAAVKAVADKAAAAAPKTAPVKHGSRAELEAPGAQARTPGTAESSKTSSSGVSRVAVSPPSKAPKPTNQAGSTPGDWGTGTGGFRLVRWRCVGGQESWLLTERGVDAEDDDQLLPNEMVLSQSQLAQKFDATKAARMVRNWEVSDSVVSSVAASNTEDWKTILEATRKSEPSSPNLAACCRKLLLLENAVRSDEMERAKKWPTMRPNWCKRMRNLGLGKPTGQGDLLDHSVGYQLTTDTAVFASRIDHDQVFTSAFKHRFGEWTTEMQRLGAVADSAHKASAGSSRRTSRGAAPAAADDALAGFDTAAWMGLVHELCDGIGRLSGAR